MGASLVYLERPNKQKHNDAGVSTENGYKYALSSMQGWRLSMEDAHICNPDFDKTNGAALFAIFDGHGGIEVAIFCERNFQECLLKNPNY